MCREECASPAALRPSTRMENAASAAQTARGEMHITSGFERVNDHFCPIKQLRCLKMFSLVTFHGWCEDENVPKLVQGNIMRTYYLAFFTERNIVALAQKEKNTAKTES